MDPTTLLDFLKTSSIVGLYVRMFSVVFAVVYLLYTIALRRQTIIMNETVTTAGRNIIVLISTLQVFIALGLLILAVVIPV